MIHAFIKTSLACLLSATTCAVALADDTIERDLGREDDVPAHVILRSISYAGSGCPAGSIEADVPTRGDVLSLLFSETMVAGAGPGVPFTQRRKNCQVLLSLAHEPGWQYSVDYVQ